MIVLADIMVSDKVIHTGAVAGVAIQSATGWPDVELAGGQLADH